MIRIYTRKTRQGRADTVVPKSYLKWQAKIEGKRAEEIMRSVRNGEMALPTCAIETDPLTDTATIFAMTSKCLSEALDIVTFGVVAPTTESSPGWAWAPDVETLQAELEEEGFPPTRRLYRTRVGRRIYFDEHQNLYLSVTEAVKAILPTSPHLVKWQISQGSAEAAQEAMEERANYGTLLHILIEQLLKGTRLSRSAIIAEGMRYADQESLPPGWVIENVSDLVADLAAFHKFAAEYNIRALFIEKSIGDPEIGIAGTLDLVCEATTYVEGLDYDNPFKSGPRKGEARPIKIPQVMRILIDFKSGRKGHYTSHLVQLLLLRHIWNVNYPEHPIDAIANWSPKEWSNAPSYSFTTWTERQEYREHSAVLDKYLAIIRDRERPKLGRTRLSADIIGDIALDSPLEWRSQTLDEYVQEFVRKIREGKN